MPHHNKKYWGSVKVTYSVRGRWVTATAKHSGGLVSSFTFDSEDYGDSIEKAKKAAGDAATAAVMKDAAKTKDEKGRKR